MTMRNLSRRSLRAAGPLGALIAAGALYYYWLNIPPPMPAPPSPNGFDALAAASRLQIKEDEVGHAAFNSRERGERVYTLPEKEDLLASNSSTIDAMHRAISVPYCVPQTNTMEEMFPEYSHIRHLAGLMILDSQVKEAHDDIAGAVNCELDAIQLGIIVPHGGGVWATLIGGACEGMGDRQIWQCVDRLDARSAASAARRLETITNWRFPFSETLRHEKWAGQRFLAEEFRRKSVAEVNQEMNGTVSFQLTNSQSDDVTAMDAAAQFKMAIANRIGGYKLFLTHSKRRIFDDYSTARDSNLAHASFPYVYREQDKDGSEINKDASTDPINKDLYGNVPFSHRHLIESRLQTGLLLSTLALHAYRLHNGRYPASLTDLVSTGILHRLPDDPLAESMGVPFGYHRTGNDKYVLYSVGPDGIDDGGRPVDLSHDAKPLRTFPEAGDKGDWVAGVNIGKPTTPTH